MILSKKAFLHLVLQTHQKFMRHFLPWEGKLNNFQLYLKGEKVHFVDLQRNVSVVTVKYVKASLIKKVSTILSYLLF